MTGFRLEFAMGFSRCECRIYSQNDENMLIFQVHQDEETFDEIKKYVNGESSQCNHRGNSPFTDQSMYVSSNYNNEFEWVVEILKKYTFGSSHPFKYHGVRSFKLIL